MYTRGGVCVASGVVASVLSCATLMTQIGKPPCDDAAILHGGPASPCSAAAQRWTLAAAILGSSMAFVDGTVVNVALPAIQRELNADAFDLSLIHI